MSKSLKLALIPIMGGSSFATAEGIYGATLRAASFLASDWGRSYNLDGHEFMVNIWEIEEGDDWVCTHRGLQVNGEEEPRDVIAVYKFTMPKGSGKVRPKFTDALERAISESLMVGPVDSWTGEPLAK